MEITHFTEFKTGHIEPITTERGPNWAFVPRPLDDKMPERLWPLVAQARDFVGRLEQIKGILADPFLLLRPLQQREALRSSSLEGTYTLPEDLLLFDAAQSEDETVSTKGNRRNEQREVWNHYQALHEGHNWIASGKTLDKSLILHLHRKLMTGVRGKDKNPGQFRKRLVAVGSRPKRFIPPPPDRIESCIDDLVAYIQSGSCEPDPLVRCFKVHYQFEAIHPFEDGNGRVGRLLLSLCASTWLRLSLPWLYLSEFFERNRREYTERMFMVSANGEWPEWLEFCLHGTIEQCKATVARCERLKELRDKYIDQFGRLGNRMHQIIDLLFVRPVIRIPQIAAACRVSQESARLDLAKLVQAGVLKEMKRTRPKAFACFGIIETAYGDTEPEPTSTSAATAPSPPPIAPHHEAMSFSVSANVSLLPPEQSVSGPWSIEPPP